MVGYTQTNHDEWEFVRSSDTGVDHLLLVEDPLMFVQCC